MRVSDVAGFLHVVPPLHLNPTQCVSYYFGLFTAVNSSRVFASGLSRIFLLLVSGSKWLFTFCILKFCSVGNLPEESKSSMYMNECRCLDKCIKM